MFFAWHQFLNFHFLLHTNEYHLLNFFSDTDELFTAGGKFMTSPKNKIQPKLKSFHEEKSPKMRMINGQSTESLESLSDELASNSGGNNSTSEVNNRRGRVSWLFDSLIQFLKPHKKSFRDYWTIQIVYWMFIISEKRVQSLQKMSCTVWLWSWQWRWAYIWGGRYYHHHGRGDWGWQLDGGDPGVWPWQTRSLSIIFCPHVDRLTLCIVTGCRVAGPGQLWSRDVAGPGLVQCRVRKWWKWVEQCQPPTFQPCLITTILIRNNILHHHQWTQRRESIN